MALLDAFLKGVETAFSTFSDAVLTASYIVVTDDGWDESTEESTSIRVIQDQFSQEDITNLSFSDLIQPTDVKGLVPGIDLETIQVSTKDKVQISSEVYAIEGFDTDPYKVLFTLLLRKV